MPDTPSPEVRPTSGLHWGPLGIVAFWLLVMGVLYLIMGQTLKPPAATISASGDVLIPRARDGHFYVDGSVGGQPITFVVDTGATLVTVSAEFAKRARLGSGTPTVFRTANGELSGRVVSGVPVSVGSMQVSSVRVGVGLEGADNDVALLGQSFLGKFDVNLTEKTMVLHARQP